MINIIKIVENDCLNDKDLFVNEKIAAKANFWKTGKLLLDDEVELYEEILKEFKKLKLKSYFENINSNNNNNNNNNKFFAYGEEIKKKIFKLFEINSKRFVCFF